MDVVNANGGQTDMAGRTSTMRRGTWALVALLAFAVPASAQEPKPAGTFGNWTAYTYKTRKGPVCYIVSQPVKSELSRKGASRDPAYFLVTHRPGDKVRGEVSTIIGYPFRKNSMPTVTIDGKTFRLFAVDDGAWTDSPAMDRKIVAAMKKGRTMVVKGVSQRGTQSVDTYSLKGVTAALRKIDELCGYRK